MTSPLTLIPPLPLPLPLPLTLSIETPSFLATVSMMRMLA